MKMENLFVTWQQRSTPATMPISVSDPSLHLPRGSLILPRHCVMLTALFPQAGELETLKQSSRLVHYCATAMLFDPAAWLHGPPETSGLPEGQVRLTPRLLGDLCLPHSDPPLPSPAGWLTEGRIFLDLYSHSGAIALSQGLGAERPPQAVNPWMCRPREPVRSLG